MTDGWGWAVGADQPYPDLVPTLVDPGRGVTLRAVVPADLPAVVEQCRDPDFVRWTPVPDPYALDDARSFLDDVVVPGWRTGDRLSWAVEAGRNGRPAYCGTIALHRRQGDEAELGFGLHPGARGRGIMSAAARLVRDFAFDRCGVGVLRWRAQVGHWASRRVAAAAGFRFDGTVRGLLLHRGERRDGWVATLLASDPRADLGWHDPPRITGDRVLLRPFTERDLPRMREGSDDARTHHWLVSLPTPYTERDASAYLEGVREEAAQGVAYAWCIADRAGGRCLGGISLDGFGGYHQRSEIGYWAHPDARGRGVVGEAVRLVTAYAEESLPIDSLTIRCAGGNTASRRVAEAAGYREVGALRAAEPLGDGTLDDLVLYARP